MKNIKSRILLIFLANLILFNSFGFGLVEHSCNMRSKKSYSFTNKASCQGCDTHKITTNGKTTISQTKCCEDKQSEKPETISEITANFISKVIKSAAQIFYQAAIWLSTILYEAILSIIGFYNQDHSSASGKNLLLFIQLLRL
jgi:ethanolamine utilization cobalamin adenosyltransferase